MSDDLPVEKVQFVVEITRLEPATEHRRSWERLSETGNEHDKGPVYGYANYTKDVTRVTTVFRQVVDSLNLSTVVKVINQVE